MSEKQSESNQTVDYRALGPLYAGWARFVSLVMACVLSVLLFALPTVVATDVQNIKHGLLSMCMLGISAGFIHGVGFVPKMAIWRWLFSPYVAWPIMVAYCTYLWFFK